MVWAARAWPLAARPAAREPHRTCRIPGPVAPQDAAERRTRVKIEARSSTRGAVPIPGSAQPFFKSHARVVAELLASERNVRLRIADVPSARLGIFRVGRAP